MHNNNNNNNDIHEYTNTYTNTIITILKVGG